MRSRRRRDGLLIVLVGLLSFAAAVHALPEPPADLDRIVANNRHAVDGQQDTSGIYSLEIGLAMQDLVANQIQIMVDQSANSLPQVRAGKIKAYAVTAKARSAAAPEIPTAAEAGYPMDVSIWNGLRALLHPPPLEAR